MEIVKIQSNGEEPKKVVTTLDDLLMWRIHEMRNPISTAYGASQVVAESLEGLEDAHLIDTYRNVSDVCDSIDNQLKEYLSVKPEDSEKRKHYLVSFQAKRL